MCPRVHVIVTCLCTVKRLMKQDMFKNTLQLFVNVTDTGLTSVWDLSVKHWWLEKMNNHANLNAGDNVLHRIHEPVVSLTNFLFLPHLTGRQAESVRAWARPVNFAAEDVWKGKQLMQISCSLLGTNTWAPAVCCAARCPCIDMLLVRVNSICALCNTFFFPPIWVAAEVPQHWGAKTLSTRNLFSALFWRTFTAVDQILS